MRWSTYLSPEDSREHVGLLYDGAIRGLPFPGTLTGLLGDHGQRLEQAREQAMHKPAEVVPVSAARFRAPIPRPPSIRDFMAFEEHVRTSATALGHDVNPVWYDVPLFYFTNPAAVRGPLDDVPVAPGSSCFDYELEIAAVIGRAGSDLDPATAEQYIAGYLVMCDWSARDLQAHEMKGHLGPAKGKDTATSFSATLVTPDELQPFRAGNAYDLTMTATVNGRPYSAGRFADIYWRFGELLAYASRGTTLVPGDIIASGTVGTGCILELSRTHGADAYPWLQPGDKVRLEVAHLGAIESTIVAGQPVKPLRPAATGSAATGPAQTGPAPTDSAPTGPAPTGPAQTSSAQTG
jgi:2-keto-4-pentenoate hydratase/2-oxohepta-3-ene-1,7-dioic acid hydratase in catechol pathway